MIINYPDDNPLINHLHSFGLEMFISFPEPRLISSIPVLSGQQFINENIQFAVEEDKENHTVFTRLV